MSTVKMDSIVIFNFFRGHIAYAPKKNKNYPTKPHAEFQVRDFVGAGVLLPNKICKPSKTMRINSSNFARSYRYFMYLKLIRINQ